MNEKNVQNARQNFIEALATLTGKMHEEVERQYLKGDISKPKNVFPKLIEEIHEYYSEISLMNVTYPDLNCIDPVDKPHFMELFNKLSDLLEELADVESGTIRAYFGDSTEVGFFFSEDFGDYCDWAVSELKTKWNKDINQAKRKLGAKDAEVLQMEKRRDIVFDDFRMLRKVHDTFATVNKLFEAYNEMVN